MISVHSLRYLGRTALFLVLITNMTLAAAAAQVAAAPAHKKGGKGSVESPAPSPIEFTKPELLNADTNPTLRYPAAGSAYQFLYAGGLAYGWFDVTRTGIHFSVVDPPKKSAEGFYLPTWQIKRAEINESTQVAFSADGQTWHCLFFLPQDHWGAIRKNGEARDAAAAGAMGTASMLDAVKDFDRVLAMVKPPAPVVVAPVAPAPQEPKPAAPTAPPAIALASPPGAGPNQTVETNEASLVVRGIATDSSGLPIVKINGVAANMRPQNAQTAEFWSDPMPLQPGDNPIQISASNSAHEESTVAFKVHYTPAATPVNPRALDKAAIISLLAGAVESPRVAEIVTERGIKFSPTADDLNEIRAAGGTDELIQAIQRAAPRP
jgi:hypothetical protein